MATPMVLGATPRAASHRAKVRRRGWCCLATIGDINRAARMLADTIHDMQYTRAQKTPIVAVWD